MNVIYLTELQEDTYENIHMFNNASMHLCNVLIMQVYNHSVRTYT